MTNYQGLRPARTADRRTIEGLQRVRGELRTQGVPLRTDGDLLLATWNIREFSGKGRQDEPLYYMAEIISAFDMVAVEEVQRDLNGLQRLVGLLGKHWKYLVTDVTDGSLGGWERIAIVYDTRKVEFSGFVGEVVIPPGDGDQAARTPLVAGFTVGWAVFSLVAVHIIFGSGAGADERRADEIRRIGKVLRDRATSTARRRRDARRDGGTFYDPWAENVIWLGDFNIYGAATPPGEAMAATGFTVPEGMQDPSNLKGNAPFDQIAVLEREDRFGAIRQSGVFHWERAVFRTEDESVYAEQMGAPYEDKAPDDRADHYDGWRTYQMSDHLPRWVQLTTDYSDEYLERRLSEG